MAQSTTIFQKDNKESWHKRNKEVIQRYKKKWFKKFYKENKEKILERQRNRYMKNIDKVREYQKNYRKKNGELLKLKLRRWNNNRRRNIIEFLGGKCIKCGFSDWRALQIDHVRGDGYIERSERKGNNNLSQFYRLIEKDIEEKTGRFQLLCSNCNWIKKYENFEGYKGI